MMAVRGLWRMAPLMALLSLVAVVSMASPARAAGVPIEGKLLVVGVSDLPASVSYFMNGASDQIMQSPTYLDMGDISPDMTKVAYSVRSVSGLWHASTGEIWVAGVDGSGATDLSGPTGLGGVNCHVRWSPDGLTLAFMHATPAAGQMTCDAGWQVWLMNSDGIGLRQWLPSSYQVISPTWSPDGYSITAVNLGSGYVTADATGAHIAPLPLVGMDAEWSKDGSKLAYGAMVPDVVAGESGTWRQFLVAGPDGSDPVVVWQQFVGNSDITAHIAKHSFQPPDHDWVSDILGMVGPHVFRWSPLGNQVAFIAATPFDPNGPEFWYQREVWLYDFPTQQLTRLTSDSTNELCLSWAGPNTTSAHPTVTVNNTTVTFPEVGEDGWTSITRTEDLPALPESYFRLDNFYQLHTTAQVTGATTISMTYGDGDVAATAESHLAILRYDGSQWQKVAVTRDTTANEVSGDVNALGLMGLAYSLPASNFTNVSSDPADPYWALWEIEAAYAAGIVKGSGGYYFPSDPVTRDQLAVYIARAMNGADLTGSATVPFVDITNPWANVYIAYCIDHGVVKGFDATHYGPTLEVDRGSMAVFIARAKGWVSIDDAMNTAPELFTNVPAGYWSGTAVQACVDHGVVKGYDATHFQPTWIVSRDQMAVFVTRAFNLPM